MSSESDKRIETLIDDIYAIFQDPSHKVDEQNLDKFLEEVRSLLLTSLEKSGEERPVKELRMSKIGTKDRKLWYEFNTPVEEVSSVPSSSNAIKFLYGHILESLLLFLVREAGHKVTGEQTELEYAGVKGHRDCKIDDVTVDVKSASNFSFRKFSTGSLFNDDPFGYIPQISGYHLLDPEKRHDHAAFLSINKETGELCLLFVNEIDMLDPKYRIDHVKKVVQTPEPPTQKCYDPEPDGKSGNMVLNKNCTYCPFKKDCWSKDANGGQGLKAYQYANGVKYFTDVVSQPSVPEITDWR